MGVPCMCCGFPRSGAIRGGFHRDSRHLCAHICIVLFLSCSTASWRDRKSQDGHLQWYDDHLHWILLNSSIEGRVEKNGQLLTNLIIERTSMYVSVAFAVRLRSWDADVSRFVRMLIFVLIDRLLGDVTESSHVEEAEAVEEEGSDEEKGNDSSDMDDSGTTVLLA